MRGYVSGGSPCAWKMQLIGTFASTSRRPPERTLAFGKNFSTALTFSASAIALAPSSPILFQHNSRLVKTALTFSASAIAMAPSGPMLFLYRCREVKTLVKTT